MSYTVEYVMEIPAGLTELPELAAILLQRILAEGYAGDAVDPGKCIFKRNCGFLSRATFLPSSFECGGWDKAPTMLTVSYIPTPKRIEVKFNWECLYNPRSEAEANGYAAWCENQFDAFLEHVNDWMT